MDDYNRIKGPDSDGDDAAGHWLLEHGRGEVVRREALAGGSINSVCRLHLRDGADLVLKTHPDPPEGFFQAEAEGLRALASADALRVPEVIHWQEGFILLEDLGQGRPGTEFWRQLGRGVAALHADKRQGFGFHCDTYCGSTLQRNPLTMDGFEFFAAERLVALASRARDAGLLGTDDVRRLERIAGKLDRWIPVQPPVLLHGDLWSGNIHCDAEGRPTLIDPAVYWGWAEADLAMTRLFGGFDGGFYESYAESGAVQADWEDRADLYNLYHLLNHLLLFGGSYLGSVQAVCRRYG